ncbi:Hypothetical predicted protein [Podarcis lilfordi]|uniref:Uncharacterized protein n=1 Tax=Podarcis lilfordi TaxID=74358 RepID=A0AA35PHA3_9SAUR|nr:Hypothetical predicted protein [Podarcis lilfordi]
MQSPFKEVSVCKPILHEVRPLVPHCPVQLLTGDVTAELRPFPRNDSSRFNMKIILAQHPLRLSCPAENFQKPGMKILLSRIISGGSRKREICIIEDIKW